MTTDGSTAQTASQNGTATNGNSVPRAKVCVYCGASAGTSPAHMEAARELGKILAENNIDLGKSLPRVSRGGQLRHSAVKSGFLFFVPRVVS